MKNCIFCKITAGELPADKVYEDDLVLAFLDIAPLSKGHTLVIPKEHHTSITTVPAAHKARMMEIAPRLGAALMRATDADGFNLLLSNGTCAGQLVPHAHLHIVPRRPDDGILLPTSAARYRNEQEKAEILEKTRRRVQA